MTINLNPDKTEVVSSYENETYRYDTVLFKDNGMKIRIRYQKVDNDMKLCVNDFLNYVSIAGEKIKASDFIQYPIVNVFKSKIDTDHENYYIDIVTFNTIFSRLSKIKGSGLDWNVTRPNTLTIGGQVHAESAVLGGFLIDDEKFQSLAETNGKSNIQLNGTDGSGHLAGGNIVWDAMGNLFISGLFESNKNGNRIVINPDSRKIQFIDSSGTVNGEIGFATDYEYGYLTFRNKQTGSYITLSDNVLQIMDGQLQVIRGKILLSGLVDRNNADLGQVYLDGETLKVRTS